MSDTLKGEIKHIALFVLILGAVQIVIAALTDFVGVGVILGTLLGCGLAIFNFALMGVIMEIGISRKKGASGIVGIGYALRLLIIAAVIVWAMCADYLNYLCVAIPLTFPQISIFILNKMRKKETDKNERT